MGHPKSKFSTRILLYLSNIKIDEKKVTKTGNMDLKKCYLDFVARYYFCIRFTKYIENMKAGNMICRPSCYSINI